jgi:hypothetical protein
LPGGREQSLLWVEETGNGKCGSFGCGTHDSAV